MGTLILGISAYYHDSAAALVCDGEIVAAVQEERFTRKKHDAAFPTNAIKYCLQEVAATLADVDYIVVCDKPRAASEHLLASDHTPTPTRFGSVLTALPFFRG